MLGAEHLDTLTSMYNHAITLKTNGNIDKAISLMKMAADGQSKRLGLNHPDTQDSLECLAEWSGTRDQGSSEDAGS